MEKHIVTGIYNKEIFIAVIEDGKIRGWDVLRPVSTEDLEKRRDPSEIKEYCRDLWKEAVRAGVTEDSLDDYVDAVIAESDMDDNEEMYPGKDESDCDYLIPDIREEADTYMSEEEGIEIGTWESSGCYEPSTHWFGRETPFQKWDYVFKSKDAQKYAKQYEESLK